jgi:hypothetical protein
VIDLKGPVSQYASEMEVSRNILGCLGKGETRVEDYSGFSRLSTSDCGLGQRNSLTSELDAIQPGHIVLTGLVYVVRNRKSRLLRHCLKARDKLSGDELALDLGGRSIRRIAPTSQSERNEVGRAEVLVEDAAKDGITFI